MPGTIIPPGGWTGVMAPVRRPDRWLNFQYAWPPESNIRDREDSPGARNPYNLWGDPDCIGDETIGEAVTKLKVYDDDIRFGGTKAASFVIQGQCLDSGGSPVPGATVELWLSSPGWDGANEPRLIATTVANADGIYGFAVGDTTTKYFVIAYVSSKGGITVRNLTGA